MRPPIPPVWRSTKPLVTIEFVQRCGVYQEGDRAGFTQADAERLIAMKYARPVLDRAGVTKSPEPPASPQTDRATQSSEDAGGSDAPQSGQGEKPASRLRAGRRNKRRR